MTDSSIPQTPDPLSAAVAQAGEGGITFVSVTCDMPRGNGSWQPIGDILAEPTEAITVIGYFLGTNEAGTHFVIGHVLDPQSSTAKEATKVPIASCIEAKLLSEGAVVPLR